MDNLLHNLKAKIQKQVEYSKQILSFPQITVFKRFGLGTEDEDRVKGMFEVWMIEHARVYNSHAEKEKRFEAFKENVREVERHNSTGNPTWQKGLDLFSDMTPKEFTEQYCNAIDPSPAYDLGYPPPACDLGDFP